MYGGSLQSLLSQFPGITSEHTGMAIIPTGNRIYEGYWSSPISQRHQSYRITGARIAILYRPNHSTNQYRNAITHELGHALGWFGHSGSSTDIISPTNSTRTTLTNRDIQHLSPIYAY